MQRCIKRVGINSRYLITIPFIIIRCKNTGCYLLHWSLLDDVGCQWMPPARLKLMVPSEESHVIISHSVAIHHKIPLS